MRELVVSERAELDRLLDEVMIAHVGLSTGSGDVGEIPLGRPCVTITARTGGHAGAQMPIGRDLVYGGSLVSSESSG